MSQEHFEAIQFKANPYVTVNLEYCLIAALDWVSENPVSDLSYAAYLTEYRNIKGKKISVDQAKKFMIKHLMRADNNNCDYIKFLYVPTRPDLVRILDQARKNRERVIVAVDTFSPHVVGLRPVIGTKYWQMAGTGVPTSFELKDSDVFRYLKLTNDQNQIKEGAYNLILLGPEKKPFSEIPYNRTGEYEWHRETTGLLWLVHGLLGLIR